MTNKVEKQVDPQKEIERLKQELNRAHLAMEVLSNEKQKTDEEKAFIMADLKVEKLAHKKTLEESKELIKEIQDLQEQLNKK